MLIMAFALSVSWLGDLRQIIQDIINAPNTLIAIVIAFLLFIGFLIVVAWRIYENLVQAFRESNERLIQTHEQHNQQVLATHKEHNKQFLEESRLERKLCEQRYESVRKECHLLRDQILEFLNTFALGDNK